MKKEETRFHQRKIELLWVMVLSLGAIWALRMVLKFL